MYDINDNIDLSSILNLIMTTDLNLMTANLNLIITADFNLVMIRRKR